MSDVPYYERPPNGRLGNTGYADGNYSNECLECGDEFVGDKMAVQCLRCAAFQLESQLEAERVTEDLLKAAYWDYDARVCGYPPHTAPCGNREHAFVVSVLAAIDAAREASNGPRKASPRISGGMAHRSGSDAAAELESHPPSVPEGWELEHDNTRTQKFIAITKRDWTGRTLERVIYGGSKDVVLYEFLAALLSAAPQGGGDADTK